METAGFKRSRISDEGVFSPLSLAAYATWALVMSDLWRNAGEAGAGLERYLGVAAGAAWLATYVVRELSRRTRWPETVETAALAAQAMSSLAAIYYGGSGVAAVLLVIFAAQLAGCAPLRVVIAVIVPCNLAVYAIQVAAGEPRALFATALYTGFQVFAIMAMRHALEAERARDALATANAALVATRSLLDESARAEERLRMSRELHDVAGHGLTALKLNLELAHRTEEPERGRRVRQAIELADGLLADLRGVVGQLRRHDGIEVAAALAALAERMPGLAVELELDPALRLPTMEQGEALLRCVQEALTNAARHADARRVTVRVQREDDRVRVRIADDGRGSVALVPGHGLAGMRERFATLGGEVRFETAPGRGFVVDASLPAT